MSNFARVALLVVKKDLMVEARSLEVVSTTLFFALTVVLVFAFGLVREGRPVDDVAAAILWIATAFSGTLALGRTFERERQADTLRALMLAPADRPAIYAGKLAGMLLLMALVELVLVPLVGLLFQAPVFAFPLHLAALLIAGTTGFAAVGTLFAAMLVRARSRDVMLPILLYPDHGSGHDRRGPRDGGALPGDAGRALARFWIALLVFFDVVFVTLALWTFEPVMTE